jgi:hypothetical protein
MNLFRLKKSNSTNHKFNERALLLVALVLAYFALSPIAQAVVPAPDGGYPNGNTAEGEFALDGLTTGSFNTALGDVALFSNTEGEQNTATGAGALFTNTLGNRNTANGLVALFSNTEGGDNTATGFAALYSNTIGGHNTANGSGALLSNTIGADSTAVGFQALQNNDASNNTAIGAGTLNKVTAGNNNTAVGFNALHDDVMASFSTAVGSRALEHATKGFNIAVGFEAGLNVTTALGVIAIGSLGDNVDGSCFIGNIGGVTTNVANAIPVLIDSHGQLGTASSSQRFKKDIKPMQGTSNSILDLKPVTFHYRSDKSSTPQFGLIAEEVAKVNPDLVVHDKDGQIYTVRYDAVNAMLLNEFLKEHRTVQEQQKEIDALKAELKEQRTLIQKVNDKVELDKPAPQTVLNNH